MVSTFGLRFKCPMCGEAYLQFRIDKKGYQAFCECGAESEYAQDALYAFFDLCNFRDEQRLEEREKETKDANVISDEGCEVHDP